MIRKLLNAGLFVLFLSAVLVGTVYAGEENHIPKVRVLGEITSINIEESSFVLHSRNGEDLSFLVLERTKFRSPDGSIEGLGDLEVGMKALVVGVRHPERGLVALMVAAGRPDDLPQTFRLKGKVDGIDLQTATLSVMTESGESARVRVIERTRFRSQDGSVSGIEDLEIGMPVVVAGVKPQDGLPQALIVFAVSPDARPQRFERVGLITKVVPGQNEFDIQTRAGERLTISVVERTRFRSRDGSIEGIHDLKKGMHAIVVGVVSQDGRHIALLVAAGEFDQDDPRPAMFDVKAAGRITAIGENSFTLETRHQGSLTFSVDGSTRFRSRDGRVDSLDDLEVGMLAAVGAKELGNGDLKAQIVGVAPALQEQTPRTPESDTDQRSDSAFSDPG